MEKKGVLYDHLPEFAGNDRAVAELLVHGFMSDLEKGIVSHQMMRGYMVSCFQRLLDGDNPKHAFNLVKPSNAPKKEARDKEVLVRFLELREQGKDRQQAYGIIADELVGDLKDRTVKDLVEKVQKVPEYLKEFEWRKGLDPELQELFREKYKTDFCKK